jgi:glycosyltransferase involved in cell wall biosynthesis
MNICLISEEFPPATGWGGIASYTYSLSQGLTNLGHKVTVVAGVAWEREEENYLLEGCRVYRVKCQFSRSLPGRIYFKSLRRLLFWYFPITLNHLEFSYAVYRKVKEISAEGKIDVIESPEYDLGAFFCKLFLNIPVVVKLHTPVRLGYFLNRLKLNADVYLHDILCRFMVKKADLVTSPSRAMLEKIRLIWGENTPKIIICPNPIDENKFRPPEKKAASDFILYTGRLEKRKGVHILLGAFLRFAEAHPEVKLMMIGLDTDTFKLDGRKIFFREYLESKKISGEVKGRIVLTGKMERDELITYYQRAIFGVFPSEEFDNFPYTCLEAISCGLPMVYTRSGGAQEMMEEGKTGLAADAGDSHALYLVMLKMFEDKDLLHRMAKEARKRVLENYALEIRCRGNLELYRSVAKQDA